MERWCKKTVAVACTFLSTQRICTDIRYRSECYHSHVIAMYALNIMPFIYWEHDSSTSISISPCQIEHSDPSIRHLHHSSNPPRLGCDQMHGWDSEFPATCLVKQKDTLSSTGPNSCHNFQLKWLGWWWLMMMSEITPLTHRHHNHNHKE